MRHAGRPSVAGWVGVGLAGFALLPWYAAGAAGVPGAWWAALLADPQLASGLWQALLLDRPGLLAAPIALAACLGVARWSVAARGDVLLMLLGFGTAAWLAAYAGWMALPRLPLGWGAALVLACLLLIGAQGLARAAPVFKGDALAAAAAVGMACVLAVFVAYPLLRGLGGAALGVDGNASLALLAERVGSVRIWGLACLGSDQPCGVAWNTLLLAVLTATGTTALATLLAFAELRCGWRFARAVRVLAPLSFVAPPFVPALALILLFGRSGVISQALEWALGLTPSRWLYGLPGLWLAQLFAFTPIAYLIVRSALAGLPQALEETARTLNASRSHIFRRVTLPLLAPGLAHAFLVGFVESVGDFGSPIVIGGTYAVLSTEIFFAIIGAQFTDTGRAAALAGVLALVALGVFALQRAVLRGRDYAAGEMHAAAAPPLLPSGWRALAVGVTVPWLLLTLGLYACAVAAAFVEVWGRDFQPTLAHLERAFGLRWEAGTLVMSGLAWPSLINSLWLACMAAPVTAAGSLLIAWLLQRHRFPGQRTLELVALMPIAVPGTVLGLCYVLVFSGPPVHLAGGAALIALCLVFRNLPVAVGIASNGMRQVDPALDDASRVLGVPSWRTLWHVDLPLLRPALTGALVYSFVRSMTTVSAVVFLVTAETDLATTYIIGRVGQGDYGLAFAYSTALVLLLSVFMAAAHRLGQGGRLARAGHRPARLARALR